METSVSNKYLDRRTFNLVPFYIFGNLRLNFLQKQCHTHALLIDGSIVNVQLAVVGNKAKSSFRVNWKRRLVHNKGKHGFMERTDIPIKKGSFKSKATRGKTELVNGVCFCCLLLCYIYPSLTCFSNRMLMLCNSLYIRMKCS